MTPNHHPADELLVEYAAGETEEAVSLVIACHATLCPPCRQRLADLESVGGALLEQAPARELRPGALEAALDALDAEDSHGSNGGSAAAPAEGAARDPSLDPSIAGSWALPRPLLRHLQAAAGWKLVVPGVRGIRLGGAAPGALLRLVHLRPGMTIPLHDHGGSELTLVFSGGLIEADRVLHRGDLAVRQPGERHVQQVEPGTPCIALTLNQGPLVPLTWLGRLLTFIARE